MQKIIFTTSAGTVSVDDVNCSSVGGEKLLRLSNFDGNSKKNKVEAVQCIGMAGKRTLSALPDVMTATADIAFAPIYLQNNRLVCTGVAGMYALRREVLSRFPLGRTGTLKYINDAGEYEMQARIDEMPVVSVKNGWLCECRLMFTADYPYWSSTVKSEKKTVTGGGLGAVFTALNIGDAQSPVSCLIHCESAISLAYGDRMIIGGGTGSDVHIVKDLAVNEELYFSFEYGNNFVIQKRTYVEGSYSTAWEDAYEYIDFPVNFTPPRVGIAENGITATEFGCTMYASGTATVQLNYHYLYNAI